MNRTFIVTPEAERDALEAYWWYEDERAGLGERFMEAVGRAFLEIQSNPFSTAARKRGARRRAVAGFPYGVFYMVGDDHITVIAVHHAKRDPQSWEVRI